MLPGSTKTKLIWSLSKASFDAHSPEELAQKLISHQLGAVRATFTSALSPHLQNLRTALFSQLAQNRTVPTPEGWIPFVLAFAGRRALLKVPGGRCDLEAGKTLPITLRVAEDPALFSVKPLHDLKKDAEATPHIEIVVNAEDMLSHLKVGTRLCLSYGQAELEVLSMHPSASAEGKVVTAQVRVDTTATVLTGMDVHSDDMPRDLFPMLPQDENSLATSFDGLADYVIVPGIRNEEHLLSIKRALLPGADQTSRRHPSVAITSSIRDTSARIPPRIVLKVDSKCTLDLLPQLLPHVDGVFLSRSELGLSVHPNSLPIIQKEVIATCNQAAKIVIVASELMYSMRTNPNPTRAEVSDMTNAISDGADALVLAEEVTEGPYGDLVAEVSRETIKSAEPFFESNWQRVPFNISNDDDAIASGALQVAHLSQAKAIVCLTEGGYTALRLSSLRAPVDIIAVTYNKHVMRQLGLIRSVFALTLESLPPFDQVLTETKLMLHKYYGFQRGDKIVFVTLTASPVAARNSNLFTVQEID